ncbi:hypothetical protein C8F04DRAFT_1187520 [Mycena alexandri]|uniref:Uncharacterized protein n=1 Tax=Mycena alexandri TaxID=1745969 RepID=A0AAD6SL58_9AGAR|nr:hypothetical protein C8F04DRAFT_1187520 [Mycena alexandri]
MYLQAKGSKKGWKKGAQSGGFTVALFLALFALALLLYLVSFTATKFISSLLDPFYEKGKKKPGGKQKKWENGRKKGVKMGGERATVNDPNHYIFDESNLERKQTKVGSVRIEDTQRMDKSLTPPLGINPMAECKFPAVARRACTLSDALVNPMSCNCWDNISWTDSRPSSEKAYLRLEHPTVSFPSFRLAWLAIR